MSVAASTPTPSDRALYRWLVIALIAGSGVYGWYVFQRVERLSELNQRQLASAGMELRRALENAVATVGFLKSHEQSNGNVGAVGFCFGGGIVNQTAVHAGADLTAGVAYYGSPPEANDVPKIEARMMLHYAGLDERVNAGIPAYEEALKAAGVDYQLFMYDNANHAFNNDTSEARYNKEAADLAWSRSVAFLKETLAK